MLIDFLIIMLCLLLVHLIVHIIFNREWFEVSNNFKWFFAQILTWVIITILIIDALGGKI